MIGLERVFVEQGGQISAVSVKVELARDVRDVVAGFLEDHPVAAATDCGVRICVGLLRAGSGFHWSTERRYWLYMR